MKVERVLLYEGPHDWIEKTLRRSEVQCNRPMQFTDSEGYVTQSITQTECQVVDPPPEIGEFIVRPEADSDSDPDYSVFGGIRIE